MFLYHSYIAALNKFFFLLLLHSPSFPSPHHPASGSNDALGVVEELEQELLLDIVVLVQAPCARHAV
jgi:hypothetical protein